MTWTNHQQKIAVALAHAAGLDWARWARGETDWPMTCGARMRGHTCQLEAGHDGSHLDVSVDLQITIHWRRGQRCELYTGHDRCILDTGHAGSCYFGRPQPVPDPMDEAAYVADCARRGVEPGPLPRTTWHSDMVSWSVGKSHAEIWIGMSTCEVQGRTVRWSSALMTIAEARELLRYAEAAIAAMEDTDDG